MADKKIVLTRSGFEQLKAELDDLKVNKVKENIEAIKAAKEQGDLSENAEYDAARDEQRDIAARIEEIEKILKNSEVVEESEEDMSKIGIGRSVVLKDIEFDEEIEFRIAGSTEASSLKGIISNDSPVGAALMGKRVGDKVEVETPSGIVEYEVISIK